MIRWSQGVEKVHYLIRALTPHIGARTFHPGVSGPIKVLRSKILQKELQSSSPSAILPANKRILVACGEGVLEILELQTPGGRALSVDDFLRGRRLEGAFSS